MSPATKSSEYCHLPETIPAPLLPQLEPGLRASRSAFTAFTAPAADRAARTSPCPELQSRPGSEACLPHPRAPSASAVPALAFLRSRGTYLQAV